MTEYKSAAELRVELRTAELREADEKRAKLKSTPVVRRYTIKPGEARWHEVYDDSCLLYELSTEITNLDEARAAGHPDHDLRAGGMTYIFNTCSGKIVMGVGGGTIWIGTGMGGQHKDAAHNAMSQISQFLISHPEGGDITRIVENFKRSTK